MIMRNNFSLIQVFQLEQVMIGLTVTGRPLCDILEIVLWGEGGGPPPARASVLICVAARAGTKLSASHII